MDYLNQKRQYFGYNDLIIKFLCKILLAHPESIARGYYVIIERYLRDARDLKIPHKEYVLFKK